MMEFSQKPVRADQEVGYNDKVAHYRFHWAIIIITIVGIFLSLLNVIFNLLEMHGYEISNAVSVVANILYVATIIMGLFTFLLIVGIMLSNPNDYMIIVACLCFLLWILANYGIIWLFAKFAGVNILAGIKFV